MELRGHIENAAYKVFAHGLGVHRHDLESEQDMLKFLDISPKTVSIDIDQAYATQIKIIYSRILNYATRLQKLSKPTHEQIETIRNILVADRLLVQIVKRMKPLQENLERYMSSENVLGQQKIWLSTLRKLKNKEVKPSKWMCY